MQKALLPYGNAQQRLNLITCAGKLTPDRVTMTDRLVVYAHTGVADDALRGRVGLR